MARARATLWRESTLVVFLILPAGPRADSPEHMVTDWAHGCAWVQRDRTGHGFGVTQQNNRYMDVTASWAWA